jgi:hypothetical protein
MKILIIDKYNFPRDLAQMDIYNILSKNYEVIFATPENLIDSINNSLYDYLYLGIYHPWCGFSQWKSLFEINKKPILIDQADNEGFMARKETKIKYEGNCILLSRYLPNEKLKNFWKGKLYLLPWYINPERIKPQEKNIDVAFVCTINIISRLGADRKKLSKEILKYCEINKLSYKIGEFWGKDYIDIITSSKAMVIDGSRYCLTQKYIEAAISKCLIIGEKPTSPPNNFITINLEEINTNNKNDIISFNYQYAIENFANEQKFLKIFNQIILNF